MLGNLPRLQPPFKDKLGRNVDAAAKKLIARECYDSQLGARLLKRATQEHLLDPLATKLLAGEFNPGDKINASAPAAELIFGKNRSQRRNGAKS